MQLKPCIESPRQKKPFSLGEKVAVGVGVALLFLFIIVASLSWFKKKNDVSGSILIHLILLLWGCFLRR